MKCNFKLILARKSQTSYIVQCSEYDLKESSSNEYRQFRRWLRAQSPKLFAKIATIESLKQYFKENRKAKRITLEAELVVDAIESTALSRIVRVEPKSIYSTGELEYYKSGHRVLRTESIGIRGRERWNLTN